MTAIDRDTGECLIFLSALFVEPLIALKYFRSAAGSEIFCCCDIVEGVKYVQRVSVMSRPELLLSNARFVEFRALCVDMDAVFECPTNAVFVSSPRISPKRVISSTSRSRAPWVYRR